ncbi:FG-GAP-like repeat-containing protein [Streptomyces sp. NPDC020412]|uniref:FG-GAP-like repeat-containing protein n=1 Tax=Streptomyces sp. NPDC020412 TaxID=3365073 RepID=UPI0037B6E9C7
MSIRRRPRTAAAVSVAAAVIVASALAPTPALAATGSPASSGAHGFIAKLEIGDGDSKRACTGVLIDTQWVLSAASCFAADPQQPSAVPAGKPQLKTTATIGRADLSGTGGHVSDIVELSPRPDRDLVMARLAQPAVGITPVAVAATPVKAGHSLTAAGYGRTKTQWIPNKLHTSAFTVNAATKTELNIVGKSANDAICKGDTGAPLLRDNNGTPELVAIASRSWQGGCLGETETRTDAIAIRTDNITVGSRLTAGQQLLPGEALVSASARLTMGTDGNLALTNLSGTTVWSSGTAGNPGATALFDQGGNLTVRSAAGAVLWASKTSAPGGQAVLHNRGNLVIQDAKGLPLWSSGTAVRDDYNRDGRSDLAAWYDYPEGHDAIFTFPARPDGGFPTPKNAWNVKAGNYAAQDMKRVTGDFNGDGIGDVAAVYGYSDGAVALWTWTGKGDGAFDEPFKTWNVKPGNWAFSRMTPHSGDFNGDGRDDLAVWYDYSDGSDKLWTFTSTTTGGFADPAVSWESARGWSQSSAKTVTGDFNGDGRDDLATFYGYEDGSEKLFTFTLTSTPAGSFTASSSWSSTTWGDWNRTSLHAGDFNGDGRDDVATWFDYAEGHDKIHVFTTTPTGAFNAPYEAWGAPAGNMSRELMKITTGDYTGDGRDDLAAMYGFGDGQVRVFTWTAKTDGKLSAPISSWHSPAGNWDFNRTHLMEHHN